jgi:hypothetical protein
VPAQNNNISEGTIQRKEQYTKGGIIYKEQTNIQGKEQGSIAVPTRTIPRKGITRR